MPLPTDPSVTAVMEILRTEFPGVPFLALGQTVFWDEPTKAVWRRLLDTLYPEADLIAGVHDTDYFAKTSAHVPDDQKFIALPHDDGRTRDLWSAAGELSALFGSESIPGRHMYLKHGVPFDWLAREYPGGKAAFYAEKTEAWGWRGIVHTESHSIIAHDVPALDIKTALLQQLEWGFALSLSSFYDGKSRDGAQRVADKILNLVDRFYAQCAEECRLSDLYQTLLPQLYQMLLGEEPARFTTTTSTTLFRFNTQTADRPRFHLLKIFLDPAARSLASACYDKAVAGSGIYALGAFGEGAIPFDLVIPGYGRGTVRLSDRSVTIETAPNPITLDCDSPITTPRELAALVESRFGADCDLVGKAVTLVDMIAAEHLVVFHETASGYTPLTRRFNTSLAAAGISQTLYPVVRLVYPTWDALSAVSPDIVFRLPEHLAAAFGSVQIPATEFAGRWRQVVQGQKEMLREIAGLHKIRDLMRFLERKNPDRWGCCLDEYEEALSSLKQVAAKSGVLRGRIEEHREQMELWRRERRKLETRKGEDWRAHIQPLRRQLSDPLLNEQERLDIQENIDRQMAIRATAFDEQIALCRERIDATKRMIAEFRRQRRLLESSIEARAARAKIKQHTYEAQMARLDIVRSAFLTIEGLEHTHYRPTAWWLSMVDSSGQWFHALTSGAQAALEPLL